MRRPAFFFFFYFFTCSHYNNTGLPLAGRATRIDRQNPKAGAFVGVLSILFLCPELYSSGVAFNELCFPQSLRTTFIVAKPSGWSTTLMKASMQKEVGPKANFVLSK